MRILIAEDEQDLNQLIKKRLKDNGYSVDACFNGKEVFDYLLCAEYDALILDIMMPKMDGIELARNLRQYHLLSVLSALVCGLLGLCAAYWLGCSAGATIALLLAVYFAVSFALRNRAA